MTSPEEWDATVEEEADKETCKAGEDGTTRKEIEPRIAETMQAKVDAGEIERPGLEGDVKRSLDRLDKKRTTTSEDFEYILAALNDETILGVDDPWLDRMAVIGTGQGFRKINRYLTVEDIDSMVRYRRQKMKEISDAFHTFADVGDAVKDAMRAGNATFMGDLFNQD